MSLEDKIDRICTLLEAILVRFAPAPTDPRNQDWQPKPPPFWNVPAPSPTVDPVYTPGLTGLKIDEVAFDWNEINSLRRIYAGQTKFLLVPAGYEGTVRLEMAPSTGNVADIAELVVMDGPKIAGRSGRVNNCYGNATFKPEGGKSYGVQLDGVGAVVQVNLLRQ